ncbi:MAG TPA: glucose-6-phosphate dehydrogenase [Planctomycetota bacterium]|nr:glucose-6-phosphate dehydrogenase [Planctomycetota bacterium]
MSESQITRSVGAEAPETSPPSQPCVMLIFGASGDLTKRLLVPALYNLACDGLLSKNFALLGTAMDALTTDAFRERMSTDIKKFHTRKEFDAKVWDDLVSRFNYVQGGFADMAVFEKLKGEVKKLDTQYKCGGNVLFYFATAPRFFGTICDNLHKSGFKEGQGWKRIIVEKPFGTDLASALKLNKEVLANWDENQIYRVDHYLGKETVQNLLAFRFSNGMFEPLWNKNYIDNIQFNVAEAVDVEGRGGYYDSSGVLRDMMQNHMFQMLAYLCMEVPGSFEPDAIRNEKAKLLQSVRNYTPEEVARYVVRGQYGPSVDDKGNVVKPGYRQEKDVNPESKTETYAAARFHIDNWRWEGVPVYLRSGKALWKRGTEIIVEFKKAPQVIFRGTSVKNVGPNRLIFHIQPYQGIEVQFQAKIPGPTLQLQPVHMKFNYGDAFKASRYTGYEVMIYSCSHGDATLFSRGDLVEAAWRVAQPLMDYWNSTPADFPNYARNSWGPKAAADLIAKDGRRWHEIVTEEVLKKVPLFKDGDMVFIEQVIMALRSRQAAAGEQIIKKGDIGRELYLVARGEVEVLDDSGKVVKVLKDGDIFGEIALLNSTPRTANVRAKTSADLFVLDKADFSRILRDNPQFASAVQQVAKERYNVSVQTDALTGR